MLNDKIKNNKLKKESSQQGLIYQTWVMRPG